MSLAATDSLCLTADCVMPTRYPLYMNHNSIQWPEGVSDGQVMKIEHDVAVLTTLGSVAST